MSFHTRNGAIKSDKGGYMDIVSYLSFHTRNGAIKSDSEIEVMGIGKIKVSIPEMVRLRVKIIEIHEGYIVPIIVSIPEMVRLRVKVY